MGARRGRVSAVVCGEAVWSALMEARPAGLTLAQLALATRLGHSQVRRGLLHIKEIAALEHETPLTWSQQGGYQLSGESEDWIRYERAQFRMELTRISRLLSGTIAPHAAARPEDEFARLLLDQLGGVKASLTLLTRH